jgi:hypothetical protein
MLLLLIWGWRFNASGGGTFPRFVATRMVATSAAGAEQQDEADNRG